MNLSNDQSVKNEPGIGYSMGLNTSYQLNSWSEIVFLISLLQKNYEIARTDSLSGAYQKYNNKYLQVPLFIDLKTGKKLRLSFEPGIFMSYWISSRTYGEIPNILSANTGKDANGNYYDQLTLTSFNQSVSLNAEHVNRFEYGWALGIQAEKGINALCGIYGSIRYYYSLSDTQEKYVLNQSPEYNRTMTLTIGIRFKTKIK